MYLAGFVGIPWFVNPFASQVQASARRLSTAFREDAPVVKENIPLGPLAAQAGARDIYGGINAY